MFGINLKVHMMKRAFFLLFRHMNFQMFVKRSMKKIILKILGGKDKNIKLRKIGGGVVLV